MSKKIGTHDGSFHCDEVLACFMLKQTPTFSDALLVRSRDPSKLETCDVVVDVGGIYDPARNRFDHHQRTFNETFATLVPGKNWNIKLSSAGLVYVHFGREVIKSVLSRFKGVDESDEQLIEVLYDKMYENFVQEVDAIDNGIEIAEKKNYTINTNLSARVGFLNLDWNSKDKDENFQFEEAIKMVGEEFIQRVRYYALNWWPAKSIVLNAIRNRFKHHESGAIVVLDQFAPWRSHLFVIEKELGINNEEMKYVLYEDEKGGWRVQCIPVSEDSFKNRLSLPSEWCGLRDDELSKVSCIQNCVFVHASGFIGGNKTFEGALEMASKALNLSLKA